MTEIIPFHRPQSEETKYLIALAEQQGFVPSDEARAKAEIRAAEGCSLEEFQRGLRLTHEEALLAQELCIRERISFVDLGRKLVREGLRPPPAQRKSTSLIESLVNVLVGFVLGFISGMFL